MRREHRGSTLVALDLVAVGLAAAVAACSASLPPAPTASLPNPDAETPAKDDGNAITALSAALMPKERVIGTPTEVYTRIARGVLTCWFGASGPLKAGYIYHADAEPASKGGNSEIKIMARDPTATDPRSTRAYGIAITPYEGRTRVEAENFRLPEPLASRLKEDVERWSADEEGCGTAPVTAGWSAEQVVETKAANKKKKQ